MPHKHKRKRDDGENNYELPPTERARPLSTSKAILFSGSDAASTKSKRKRPKADDDTPAAFKRLMALQCGKKTRSGLDDGSIKPKRGKVNPNSIPVGKKGSSTTTQAKAPAPPAPAPVSLAVPKIRPNERMNDFAARVDAALPILGLAKKEALRNADGTRKARTGAQKRQQNMQKEWREIDARYQERRAEAEEEAREEYDEIWRGIDGNVGPESGVASKIGGKRKKKGKKGRGAAGEEVMDDSDGDPWAVVKKKRDAAAKEKGRNVALVGTHDVVQEPPKLTTKPREKMKIRNGAAVDVENVPQMSGSLRRREELSGSRREVIEAYRGLAKQKAST